MWPSPARCHAHKRHAQATRTSYKNWAEKQCVTHVCRPPTCLSVACPALKRLKSPPVRLLVVIARAQATRRRPRSEATLHRADK